MIASVTKNLVLIGLIGLTLARVASADGNCQQLALSFKQCFDNNQELQTDYEDLEAEYEKAFTKCCELCGK